MKLRCLTCTARWLLFLFCVFAYLIATLQVEAQGRPDVVWMRGGYTAWVSSVSFSPDGQFLASGSGDNTIKLWRVSDGQLVRTLTGHTSLVESVSFSPDGQLLASGSGDSTIKLWRVSDGQLLESYNQETASVYSLQFSPSGEFFAYGRFDTTIVLAVNPFYTSPPEGDANHDGTVDDADLFIVLFNFGSGC